MTPAEARFLTHSLTHCTDMKHEPPFTNLLLKIKKTPRNNKSCLGERINKKYRNLSENIQRVDGGYSLSRHSAHRHHTPTCTTWPQTSHWQLLPGCCVTAGWLKPYWWKVAVITMALKRRGRRRRRGRLKSWELLTCQRKYFRAGHTHLSTPPQRQPQVC